MQTQEIRWQQRLQNYHRALDQLDSVVNDLDLTISDDQLKAAFSALEKRGVILYFEFIHELAWNVMKDYFLFQGNSNITGSRDASREAFKQGLVENGEGWMSMIKSRNQTSHTYNEDTADFIFINALREYYPLFVAFQTKMTSLSNGQENL
jgi:nucleotidyltransferase substrate binding protein (TIGR01987 family)